MSDLSTVYFQKALSMQTRFSNLFIALFSVISALIPIVISVISITKFDGNSINSITTDSIEYTFTSSLILPSESTITVGVGIVLFGLLFPILYLRLKYQEYNAKYVISQVYEITESYRTSHQTACDWNEIYLHLRNYTQLHEEEILNSLYLYYGDEVVPLLYEQGWEIASSAASEKDNKRGEMPPVS